MEQQDKLHGFALRYLSIRPRTIFEMMDYLTRKGFEAPEVEGEVTRLTKAGLLDDRQFAESWVASRQALRPRSRRRLEQELMAKRVSAAVIAEVLEGLEEGKALEAVIRKRRRLPQYADDRKLIEYLQRQGFGYDQIKKALGRLDDVGS